MQAIQVENLSKSYLVGYNDAKAEHNTAVGDELARNARNLARKTRDRLTRRQIVQGDEVEECWALKDISFEVQPGDRVGLIGRNGAGQSTGLKILSRITEPTTGRENIFLTGAILGISRREIQRKFDEIVEFAEVEKFLDTPVKRYSSGTHFSLAIGYSVPSCTEPVSPGYHFSRVLPHGLI